MENTLKILLLVAITCINPWLPTVEAQSFGTTFQQTGLLIRDGFIQSRVGCRETFVCAGVGNTLVWRRFGLRGTLQPSGDRLTINTTRISTDEDDVFSFTSLLTFNPVLHGDTGGFTCTIHPRTQTARLVVDLSPAAIDPSHHNLSSFTVGDPLSILCPVETCISQVAVRLLRGEEILHTMIVRDAGAETPQFNFVVAEGLVGEYSCTVSGIHMDQSFFFRESFNITGTPKPRPTMSGGGGGGGGGGNGGSGDDGGNGNGSADRLHAVSLLLILASLLVIFLC